jgi:hypothetical protein
MIMVLGLMAGTLAGMCFNFMLSHVLVFGRKEP